MFPYKSLVIARQLDELRAESAARHLARVPDGAAAAPERPRRFERWRNVADDAGVVLPTLRGYPFPIR